MPSLLPDSGSPAIRALPGLPTAAELATFDACLVLIPVDAAPPALPDKARWQSLHDREPTRQHGDVRATTLGGARDAAAVLGYCKSGASAFELLTAAGKLVQKALATLP